MISKIRVIDVDLKESGDVIPVVEADKQFIRSVPVEICKTVSRMILRILDLL